MDRVAFVGGTALLPSLKCPKTGGTNYFGHMADRQSATVGDTRWIGQSWDQPRPGKTLYPRPHSC